MKSEQFRKLVTIFVILYISQLAIGSFLIYYISIKQVKTSLQTIIKRVKEDITYKNGTWDTSKYYADPEIPGRFRLYVFSTDGFVVERWRPITGYLDISDLEHLLQYQAPQTIHTITNQDWRMYSKPIRNKSNHIVGVITVSQYSPDEDRMNQIDEQLKSTANAISDEITINGDNIAVDNIDIRNFPFSISIQVVDQYNSILIRNSNASSMNRIPDFIDPSYVRNALEHESSRRISGATGNDTFMTISSPLIDSKHETFGLVVAARVTTEIYNLIKLYILINAIIGIIFTSIFSMLLWVFLKNKTKEFHSIQRLSEDEVKKITFIKNEGLIKINDFTVNFASTTNQYSLCLALFSSPRKKWEAHELLDRFGEKNKNDGWRKVYDAMITINKKTSPYMSQKLITLDNKMYQINPKLLSKLV